MKNNKLIEKLKEYNPNADVTLTTSEDICIGYIVGDEGYDKSNTPIIFIEGCDECARCFFEEETFCTFYGVECSDVEQCYQFIEEDDD